MLKDHVRAEAARSVITIEETVDHRDAVRQPVTERDSGQRPLADTWLKRIFWLDPVFGDECLDDALFIMVAKSITDMSTMPPSAWRASM